jgi:hypothetical protein
MKKRNPLYSRLAVLLLIVVIMALIAFGSYFQKAHAVQHGEDIVFRVSVNRNHAPQEALNATGRNQYLTGSVVNSMPKGEGDKVEVHLFELKRFVSDDDLEKEYESRGLISADPYSILALTKIILAFQMNTLTAHTGRMLTMRSGVLLPSISPRPMAA